MIVTRYRHILWDWNGTLVDDRDLALHIVNDMLQKRQLSPISRELYLQLFDHPVMGFYEAIGLGPEVITAPEIAQEFHAGYSAGYHTCRLQFGAEQTLGMFKQSGLGQSVLSASHQQALERLVRHFGVNDCFSSVLGLNNHYADSKIELGRSWLARQPFRPAEVLLIGDTTHDFAVAKSLGCDSLLVARGHQNKSRLAACGAPVLDDLQQIAVL